MYQTLPCLSWAYQSNVRSSGFPPDHTLSSTTTASMPMMRFFRRVTRTMFSSRVVPSSPTPLYRNTVPGLSGRYGLSIGPPKSAGSMSGLYGVVTGAGLCAATARPAAARSTMGVVRFSMETDRTHGE
jgi:hypothetical protein